MLTALFWPVGVLLAWLSPRWHTKDKVVATLFPLVGLALVLGTAFAASASMSSAVQVVEQPVYVEEGEAYQGSVVTPASDPGQGIVVRLVGLGLTVYGWFGAPFTSAIYLALRLRPRPHRRAVLIPVVAASFVIVTMTLLVAVGTTFPTG